MLVLGDLLKRNVNVRPDKTAVIFENYQLTFQELNSQVNKLANALLKLGVKRGDRIGLFHTNSHLYEVIYFASIKIGAILVPINFWYKSSEIEYVINKAGVSTLVLGSNFLDTVKKARIDSVENYILLDASPSEGILNYDTLTLEVNDSEPKVPVDENDAHLILFTSGTTGVPKGAVISQRSYVLHTGVFVNEMGLNENSIGMCVYPMFHMGGIMWPCANAYSGMTLVIISTPPTPEKILEAIQKHKVTHFAAVPTLWRRLLDYPDFDKYDLSSLKVAMGASDAMPKDLLEEVIRRTPASSPQLYGLSEAGCLTYLSHEDALRKIGSSGKLHCQADLRIIDDNGKDVPRGDVGEIISRGEHQMLYYWDMPDETQKTIIDGWLHTGDLGRYDDEGFIYIVGRKKDMIISGGQNIYPAEIEKLLFKHPDVVEAAVVGVPDREWGESTLAVVVPKMDSKITEEEIIDFISKNMASYNKPRYVQFVKNLPRTAATGKIQKAELRKNFNLKTV